MRVIRKAIGLLIVDIVIIIGIFILQFRTDSSILKKIGNLQVTMTKSDSETDLYPLKNKLEVSYNGISIHTDDQNSIKIIEKDDSIAKTIQLIDYEEDELQYTFHFTQDVDLVVMLAQDDLEAPLTIYADVPKTISDVYVPFNFGYNMKVQKDEGKNIILEGKKQVWSFHTNDISENYIHFTYADNLAHYQIYDDTKKFTFEDIIQLASAEKNMFNVTISNFTENLINAFKNSTNESTLSEQAVIAYVAAMAQGGKYKQAIEDIPADYKKSDARTYLSAPFLNNLSSMDKKLESTITEMNKLIKAAASSESLDIFTTNNLSSWLCIYPEKATVTAILKKAANANIENCTVAQTAGILLAYSELSSLYKEYAAVLEPVLDDCIIRLTAACTYENDVLTISENDTFLSVVQAVQTGIALLRYGETIGNDTYAKAGRVIVNSYISESTSFDLRTLSTIYPLIAYNNWYYPHIKLITSVGRNAQWAWTCAKDITAKKDSDGSLVLSIDFPLEYTHYVIFKGIPSFEQIFIYDMAFRTDPRFETYNSSGYVYKAETETLLLKSRHKTQVEDIRMSYVAPKPAPVPAPKPAEPAAETTATETAASEASTTSDATGASGAQSASGTPGASDTPANSGTSVPTSVLNGQGRSSVPTTNTGTPVRTETTAPAGNTQ